MDYSLLMSAFNEKTVDGPNEGVTRKAPADGGGRQKRHARKPSAGARSKRPRVEETSGDQETGEVPEAGGGPASSTPGVGSSAGRSRARSMEADSARPEPERSAGPSSSGRVSPARTVPIPAIPVRAVRIEDPRPESAPGILSVAAGAREALQKMTEPEGDEGWATLDMRTYKGWYGDGPRPIDTVKAFAIPADQKYLESRTDREFADLLTEQSGKLMTTMLGARARMANLRYTIGQLRQRVLTREEEIRRLSGLLDSEKMKSEEYLKQLEAAKTELEGARSELGRVESRLEAEVRKAESEVADHERTRARLAEVEAELAKARADLAEVVPKERIIAQFKESHEFKVEVNRAAAPGFEAGYRKCIEMIGDSGVYDPSVHSWEVFLAAELRKYRAEEAAKEAGGGAEGEESGGEGASDSESEDGPEDEPEGTEARGEDEPEGTEARGAPAEP